MDSKKIQEAAAEARRASAETLTTFGVQHSIDDVVALTDMRLSYDEVAESAFEKGAEWLQSHPLSDRLTEEEKEKIKGYAKGYANGYTSMEGIKQMLFDIFGTSLFNDKSE